MGRKSRPLVVTLISRFSAILPTMSNVTFNGSSFLLGGREASLELTPKILGVALCAMLLLLPILWHSGTIPPGTKPVPGPKGLPLVGNLLEIPKKHAWLKYREYIEEYGPIVRIKLMGQDHILLGSESVVDDLLKSRSGLYSSRPQTQACSILTQDQHVLMMPAGEPLRVRRRFLSQLLTRSAASQYEPYQWLEAYRLIIDLVRDPSDYQRLIEHYSVAMGSRTMPDRSGPQKEVIKIGHTFEAVLTPGAFLVDVIPWMRHLPDAVAPWKRWLKRMSRRDEAFYYRMWERTKADLDNGRDAPSWTRMCLEDMKRAAVGGKGMGITEHEAVHLIGVTYTAFGTTVANILSLLLGMTRHPEWWLRMQAEIDDVVGAGRLPTLADLPRLPVLRAVLSEITRFWPVTPDGVPHELTQDDVYKGYHLKAGSVIHYVTWACGRDPEMYPEPDTFNPDRWIDPKFPTYKEPLTENPSLMNTLMFGAGRRQCPGMILGTRNVYVQTMMLVWACDLGRARDEVTGEEIVPPLYDYCAGFNVAPNPFKFDLKPRGAERMRMVEAAYERALAEDLMKEE
ncbi:uncharacterized protein PgNI_02378 [Pyricularia grisea]|uniref:Uncharacterized protein n=1 Tax=Pyricularia grisea TaxID=148305 RepID=A0A6P8BIM3_PYRGI|nr:uncharacterized protein PgNI_02378 [Pyricularia grisea]TLD16731.1 hypothetical protein PgNI_02378 [Pyricularia grisea]